MPYALLITMVSVSLLTALTISYAFMPWLNRILDHLASQPLAHAWRKCLNWAIILVGLQGGVRVWELENFALSQNKIPFNTNPLYWILEIYRVFIDTAQSCIWVIILFLLVALLVEAIVLVLNRKNKQT
jgi:hypothetical protein